MYLMNVWVFFYDKSRLKDFLVENFTEIESINLIAFWRF